MVVHWNWRQLALSAVRGLFAGVARPWASNFGMRRIADQSPGIRVGAGLLAVEFEGGGRVLSRETLSKRAHEVEVLRQQVGLHFGGRRVSHGQQKLAGVLEAGRRGRCVDRRIDRRIKRIASRGRGRRTWAFHCTALLIERLGF